MTVKTDWVDNDGVTTPVVGVDSVAATHHNAVGTDLNAATTKLAGIATGATANSSDATLLARANHTGSQVATTISDFQETVEDLIGTKVVGGTNVTVTYNDTAGTTTVTIPDYTAAIAAKVSAAAVPVRFGASTAVVGVSPTDYCYVARTLTGARMRVSSAPAGSALTAQVQHWNGTTWSTVGTLSISAGSTTENVISFTQAQSIGHMLRLNTTSVGSTTAATGVVADVLWS